jgi:dTMP kinase
MYESFMIYQRMIAKEFRSMQKRYSLSIVDGNRQIPDVNADLQKRIDHFLGSI